MENAIKVLLVEDSVVDQKAFLKFVNNYELPYETTVANSLKQAITYIETNLYDVVLLDYELGDGTAFSFLEICKNTPVIVITGMGTEETAVKAMKKGAFDYLIKDVHSNYLKIIPMTIDNSLHRWKLIKLQQLLSHTVKSMSDSVYITDTDHKVIFVNQSFCHTYSFDEDEIVGESDLALWESEVDALDSRVVLKQKLNIEWHTKTRHKRKDGSSFDVDVSRSAVRDEEGKTFAIVSIVKDLSERVEVEQQKELLLSELKEILDRFMMSNSNVLVENTTRNVDELYDYWRKVLKFLESENR